MPDRNREPARRGLATPVAGDHGFGGGSGEGQAVNVHQREAACRGFQNGDYCGRPFGLGRKVPPRPWNHPIEG